MIFLEASKTGKNMRLQELLEGVHDPHIFKAIFILGGPGSGKTYISSKIASGTGLKSVNLDDVYERMTMSNNSIVGKGFRRELHSYSGRQTQKRMDMYVEGRLGLLIDGTGRKLDRLQQTKQNLEALGYDTLGIFVNTDVNVALDRNDTRKRRVDPEFLKKAHTELKSNIGDIQKIFNQNFIIIDNTDPNTVDFDYYWKSLQHFINEPPHKPAAKAWLNDQKK